MPLTNFLNGGGIGGQLSRFSPNVVGANPDLWAYSRLFSPKRTASFQLDFTCWRSTPVGVGTNSVPFVVNSLHCRPISDANAPWTNFGPSGIKPGWSKIQSDGTNDGAEVNVLLTFGYMQIPPAGWPTPSGEVNGNTNEGFFFFDNPIGQTVPGPLRQGTSIWTVLLFTDYKTFQPDATMPAKWEWAAHIGPAGDVPLNISPTGAIT